MTEPRIWTLESYWSNGFRLKVSPEIESKETALLVVEAEPVAELLERWLGELKTERDLDLEGRTEALLATLRPVGR